MLTSLVSGTPVKGVPNCGGSWAKERRPARAMSAMRRKWPAKAEKRFGKREKKPGRPVRRVSREIRCRILLFIYQV
jgi:hypothetical protein